MAIIQTAIPVLCLVCFLLAPHAGGQSPKRVRVASAVYSEGNVFLFSNNGYVQMRDNREVEHNAGGDSSWLDGDTVFGAVYISYDGLTLFQYGKDFSKSTDLRTFKSETLKYSPTRKFLNDGAPDAAAKRAHKRYFFRGCQMVVKTFGWTDKPRDVRKVGLPCNMDAAWYEPNLQRMVILRGNQIWFWKDDGSVEGPKPFADTYTINSWVLEPYSES